MPPPPHIPVLSLIFQPLLDKICYLNLIPSPDCVKLVAEVQKRGDRFTQELDFVMADVLTCIFANFAAVWTSCPTVAATMAAAGAAGAGSTAGKFGELGGSLRHFIKSCPSNAFQKVAGAGAGAEAAVAAAAATSQAGHFTVGQRLTALLVPMPKLFIIGFVACAGGYGLTAGMNAIREIKNRGEGAGAGKGGVGEGQHHNVPVLSSSLAVGAFLAVSSNVRYQVRCSCCTF
ncbi:unnamed protein product [Discosporangium mesarthrocarpum]